MSAIRRNLTSGMIGSGVTVLGGILLLPLYLQHWGPDHYGQWIVLSAVPSSISLAELGLNAAFANAFVIARESRDAARADRLVSSVWKAELGMTAAALGLLVVSACALPLHSWLGIDAVSEVELVCCVALLGLATTLSILAGFFSAAYRAAERNSEFVAKCTMFKLIELVATAVLLIWGAGFLGVCAMAAAVRFIQVVWLWNCARCLNPRFRPLGASLSVPDLMSLLPSGLAFSSYSLGTALVNQGSVLGVQHLLGPAAVAQLSIARQFGRVFLQVISLVFAALHPEMNIAFARGDMARLVRLQSLALFPVLWLTPILLLIAYWAGPMVVALWTRSTVTPSASLTLASTAEALSFGLAAIILLPAWSSNQHAQASYRYLVLQLIALAIALQGVLWLGINAIGATFTAANLFQALISMRAASRIMGKPARALWAEAFRATPWGQLNERQSRR